MEYARLGGSGLVVSKVCLGTNMFGAGYVDDARAVAVVHAAAEHGINFIDTADMYNDGRSEEVVGKAIRGRRSDFVVATKGFSAMGPGPNDRGSSRRHLADAVDASLRRLGTDYIDLYLAHFWDPETPLEETLGVLDDMVRQGKVRYVGCCNFSAWQVAQALGIAWERGMAPLSVVQPEYNFARREIERDLLPLCQKHGVGVTPYQLLMGGILTGAYRRDQKPAADSHMASRHAGAAFNKYWTPECFALVDRVAAVAADSGLTTVRVALAWALSKPAVTSVIVGASRPEQVAQNAAAVDVRLPEAVLAELDA